MSTPGETKTTAKSRTLAKRLKALKGLTGEPKSTVDAFFKSDTKLQQLALREGKAEEAVERLSGQLIEQDVSRDMLLPDLALVIASAKLGTRTNPFKAFSKYSPSKLAKLGFDLETQEIDALCANILKVDPPAAVKSVVKALLKENAKVAATLDKLDGPSSAHEEALIARNRFMPEWQKSLSNLRVQMKAALASRPGAYEALFSE